MISLEKKLASMESTMDENMRTVMSMLQDIQEKMGTATPGKIEDKNGADTAEASRSGGETGPGRPKRQFEQIMAERVPLLAVTFGQSPLSRCVLHSFVTLVLEHVFTSHLSPAGFKEVLSIVFFALKKTDRKERYERGHGPKASKFRRRIMLTALHHARSDTFGLFQSEPREDAAAAEETAEKPTRPQWLGNLSGKDIPYVAKEHVIAAQNKFEKVAINREAYYRRLRIIGGSRPTRSDDGLFAMNYLYARITHLFNGSRKMAPAEFCQIFGYLFIDWKKAKGCTVPSQNVLLSWYSDYDSAECIALSDVPDAVVITAGNSAEIKRNEKIYKDFARSRSELLLNVEHDVLVRIKGKEGSARSRSGEEVRAWRRVLNVMDAAAYLVRSICGFERGLSVFDILAFHKRSIAAIYSVALVLRKVIETCSERPISNPGRADLDLTGTEHDAGTSAGESEGDRETLKDIFRMLVPSPALLDRAIWRATCAIPEEVYSAEHLDETANDAAAEQEEELPAGGIVPDSDDEIDVHM